MRIAGVRRAGGLLYSAAMNDQLSLRRNIELKARLANYSAARSIAARVADRFVKRLRQTDTYFHAPQGRLKLREHEAGEAELIWYARENQPQPKGSDYRLVAAPDPAQLKAALSSALGVRCVVRKSRELFLFGKVRIHLDQVVELGDFLEFEAVLSPGEEDAAGHQALNRLMEEFGIAGSDLLTDSYSDMLEASQVSRGHRCGEA